MLMHGGFAHMLAERRAEEARGLASEALERWVGAGLVHQGDAKGERRFDPAEVINGFKWAGLHGQDDFWRDRWIATGRRLVSEFAALDADGRGQMRVSLTRRFDLSGFPDGAELLLRTPGPLPGSDHAVLDLQPSASNGAMDHIFVADGRMTARLRKGSQISETLGWAATLARASAAPDPPELDGEEAALYLRPTEGFIRLGPRVRELAALWGEGRTGWDAVLAFRRGMGACFCLGVVGYEGFDVPGALEWVLDNGWVDCLLGSALLVSLCRASGLPARLVSGHFLYPLNPSNHAWAEVWIDGEGWRPVDLIGWDLSAGDTDAALRDSFVGRIDRRLVTERPPRRATGPMSLRLPPAWRALQTAVDGGLEIRFVDATSGGTVFVDQIHAGPASP